MWSVVGWQTKLSSWMCLNWNSLHSLKGKLSQLNVKLSQLTGKTGWNLQSSIEYQLNRSLEIVVGCVIGQFCRQFPQLEDKSIINGCGKWAEAWQDCNVNKFLFFSLPLLGPHVATKKNKRINEWITETELSDCLSECWMLSAASGGWASEYKLNSTRSPTKTLNWVIKRHKVNDNTRRCWVKWGADVLCIPCKCRRREVFEVGNRQKRSILSWILCTSWLKIMKFGTKLNKPFM